MPRSQRSTDRRRVIAGAAAVRFAASGFDAATVGQIAADVGLTPGAIYRHFTSKDELLALVVRNTLEEFCLAAVVDDQLLDSPTRIDLLAQGAVTLTVRKPDHVATYLRERHRLPADLFQDIRTDEKVLFQRWDAELSAALPSASALERATRQRAVNGALGFIARRRRAAGRRAAGRRQLESVLVRGLGAVLLNPLDRWDPPPAPIPARWRPSASRRQDILREAVSLFRAKGYHAVGIDDVGQAAGIAGPTVYGTYGGKAEILIDIYDQAMARMSVAIDDAVDGASDATIALERCVRAYAKVAFDSADLLVVTSRETSALPPQDRLRLSRWSSDFRNMWAGILGEIRPDLSDEESRTLVSGAFGLMQRIALAQPRRRPNREVAEDLAQSFLAPP